jgi:hypothetical protein
MIPSRARFQLDKGIPTARIERLLPWLFFALLLSGLEIIYGGYFPNSHGLLGHDFSYAHPALLDGAFWFWQNGLFSVPWFTPSFCGGQPFFADTISIYYSLIQWLAFVVPPTTASHLALLISCSMGYWAFFFLSRKVFCLSIGASIVAGALAMLNGFLPHRFLVGEVGFQAFLLSAFVSHALLDITEWGPWQKWKMGNSFWAGLVLAYMFQSGLSSLMIPVGLGIVAVACLAWIVRKGVPFNIFLRRAAVAVVFSGALCGAKILAGLTFMSHFPRTAYLLPGFTSWTDALGFPLLSLIFDSQTVSSWANVKLSNLQWAVLPHEWAYQFGLTYLVLILTGLCCLYFAVLRKAPSLPKSNRNVSGRTPYIIALVLILLIPGAMLWLNPQWNAFLKSLPIIGTTSFPFRWIIIWIPVACIAGAMAWQAFENTARNVSLRIAVLALFCLAMLIESGLTNRDYYNDPGMQGYDPRLISQAWFNGKHGKIAPITGLVGGWDIPENRNDYMVLGKSYIQCYNPAYGYRLETLPLGRLQAGHPALEQKDGFLNIKKPACLIWPGKNGCKVLGEEYKVREMEQAQSFLQRRPIDFEVPVSQRIANILNLLALFVTAAGLVSFGVDKIRRVHR